MLKFTAPQKLFSEVVPIHSVDWVVDSMNVHFLTIEKPQKVYFHNDRVEVEAFGHTFGLFYIYNCEEGAKLFHLELP